jgi:hypothetical protein
MGTNKGTVIELPYLNELVRRMRFEDPSLCVEISADASAAVCWQDRHVDHPLTLLVTEQDLETAVTELGESSRDVLWPDSSIQAAGFNLLLVHLEEVLVTRDTSQPLRVTSEGLLWPERRRSYD